MADTAQRNRILGDAQAGARGLATAGLHGRPRRRQMRCEEFKPTVKKRLVILAPKALEKSVEQPAIDSSNRRRAAPGSHHGYVNSLYEPTSSLTVPTTSSTPVLWMCSSSQKNTVDPLPTVKVAPGPIVTTLYRNKGMIATPSL